VRLIWRRKLGRKLNSIAPTAAQFPSAPRPVQRGAVLLQVGRLYPAERSRSTLGTRAQASGGGRGASSASEAKTSPESGALTWPTRRDGMQQR